MCEKPQLLRRCLARKFADAVAFLGRELARTWPWSWMMAVVALLLYCFLLHQKPQRLRWRRDGGPLLLTSALQSKRHGR